MHIMNNPNTRYCSKIMHYMDAKMEKARSMHVIAIGNQERRFEVRLPSNQIRTGEEVKTQEVRIDNESWPTCECTYNKPKLFVSPYFLKESVVNTWTCEMMGYRAWGNFNK